MKWSRTIMKRIAVMGAIAATAMCLFSGVVASGALAVQGPFWLTAKDTCSLFTGPGKGWLTQNSCENLDLELKEEIPAATKGWESVKLNAPTLLLAGEEALILDLSLTNFVLSSAPATITCTHVDSNGALIGGNPGTDRSNVTFLNCTVNGSPKCDVWSKGQPFGQIFVELKTELVYLENAENEKVGDLFTPKTGTTFVPLRATALTEGACPTGVPATGEEEGGIKYGTTNVKGNIVAKVEPVNKHELVGTLLFPEAKIAKAFQNVGGTLKEVKPKLTAFELSEANESGTEDVWLENDEPWGVQAF
jgi:hypothetical protein